MPLMGLLWHRWRAGQRHSVCGLPWSVAAEAWDYQADKPDQDLCESCHRDEVKSDV